MPPNLPRALRKGAVSSFNLCFSGNLETPSHTVLIQLRRLTWLSLDYVLRLMYSVRGTVLPFLFSYFSISNSFFCLLFLVFCFV